MTYVTYSPIRIVNNEDGTFSYKSEVVLSGDTFYDSTTALNLGNGLLADLTITDADASSATLTFYGDNIDKLLATDFLAVTLPADFYFGSGEQPDSHSVDIPVAMVNKANHKATGKLSVIGSFIQGQELSVSNKLKDTDGLGKMHYQWLSNDAPISGVTKNVYTLTQTDVGKTIAVRANYIDDKGTFESVTSTTVSKVKNVNDLPTGNVFIAGLPVRGEILTASNTLIDADGVGVISYQWLANGKAMKGATANTYTLTKAEDGKKISVSASYIDGFKHAEKVSSLPSDVVTHVNHLPTGTVVVSGIFEEKETLTVTNTLADLDGLGTVSYQWQADGKVIKGATKSTYTLKESDVGKAISVIANYKDADGTAESVSSSILSKVLYPENTAKITTNFSDVKAVQKIVSDSSSLLSILLGIGTDAVVLNNINKMIKREMMDTVSSFEGSNSKISYTLKNGDYVAVYGDNFLSGKYDITQLDYKFSSSNVLLSVFGSFPTDTKNLAVYSKTVLFDGVNTLTVTPDVTNKLISTMKYESPNSSLSATKIDLPDIYGTYNSSYQITSLDLASNGQEFHFKGNKIVKSGTLTNSPDNYIAVVMNGNDTVTGTKTSEYLFGYLGDDTLNAGVGDDTLEGGLGKDILDGGIGSNVAVYSGNKTSYTVSKMGAKYQISGGTDGYDTLRNIQFLQFNDGIVAIDSMLNATIQVSTVLPLPTDEKTTVTKTIGGGTLTVTQKERPYEDGYNSGAFAAIKFDGSVVTWGKAGSGGDSAVYHSDSITYESIKNYSVKDQLNGAIPITQIYSGGSAFAALRADGSVITWGDADSGGDSRIHSSPYNDPSSVTSPIPVGDSYSVADQLDGTVKVTQIYSNEDDAFAALREDGSVVTWGNSGYGGDSTAVAKQLNGTIDVVKIFTNYGAFMALRADGSVVTWGRASAGGDSSVYHNDYSVYPSVVTNYSVADKLDGTVKVTSIYSNNDNSFAALREDGSVVTWGEDVTGGDSSSVADKLDGSVKVTQIYSTNGNGGMMMSDRSSFAALREDGSVVTWGSPSSGGDSSVYHFDATGYSYVKDYSVANQLDGTIDVMKIYPSFNGGSFAALRTDGSVITWGQASSGGDSSVYSYHLDTASPLNLYNSPKLIKDYSIANQLDGFIKVTEIYAGLDNRYSSGFSSDDIAFAALREDGSVVTWGEASSGGDGGIYHKDSLTNTYIKDSSVANQLDGSVKVTKIYISGNSFAALREDGSVVTWGDSSFGGESQSVTNQLDGSIDVININSNGDAFSALRADGSVITWGDKNSGGDSSVVANELDGKIKVTNVYPNNGGFSALREDGVLVTWGASGVASNSAVANNLKSGIVSIVNPLTDNFYESPVNTTTATSNNDVLKGTSKNDTISGLEGNDTLIGGLGTDILTGGSGADVFKFNSADESEISLKLPDNITDFNSNDGDKIDLSFIDINAAALNKKAFSFIGSEEFSKTDASGQLRFDVTSHILYGSSNADNKAEFSIQLNGVSSLVISDFIL